MEEPDQTCSKTTSRRQTACFLFVSLSLSLAKRREETPSLVNVVIVICCRDSEKNNVRCVESGGNSPERAFKGGVGGIQCTTYIAIRLPSMKCSFFLSRERPPPTPAARKTRRNHEEWRIFLPHPPSLFAPQHRAVLKRLSAGLLAQYKSSSGAHHVKRGTKSPPSFPLLFFSLRSDSERS